jgi:SAM-dependent methyltransferase
MSGLSGYIRAVAEALPAKIIISKPSDKSGECRKIVVQRCGSYYQAERFAGRQAFHENLAVNNVPAYLEKLIPERFLQINAFTDENELIVMVSRNGSASFIRNKAQNTPKAKEGHNREKSYIFSEGTSIEPLIDMGVFTAEGKIVNSMYDKYRQINRFIETVDDEISKHSYKQIKAVDFGCGKGYLTFLLYYYLTQVKNIKAEIIGVDLKADVMEKCNKAAEKYGYEGLSFVCGDISTYEPAFKPDMVVSLHACDTATDYVLYNAIRWKARLIFSMPCCQHELNGQIQSENYPVLTRYGILKENLSSILTDAIRANLLTCSGYKTQVLDIVNPLNTPKNIMLRAVRANIGEAERLKALEEVKKLCDEFGLKPTLAALLKV